MDLRQLRYFVRVVETGSFTAAADRLHVSQPALGMQIRKLEDEFDTRLLFRHSRGVEPTEAGRVLFKAATAILDRVERACQELKDFSGAPKGTVALGVTPTIGRVLVPELLERCASELPQVVVTVFEGLSEEVMQGVAENRLDLAFSYNPKAAAGLSCAPLLAENLYFVGLKEEGERRGGKTIAFADVCRFPLIIPSRPHGIRTLLEETAAAAGLRLHVKLEIDSVSMEREMIERALGYTVLPFGVVSHEVEEGRLFAKEIVRPRLSRRLCLVVARRRPGTRAAAAVRRLIEATVAECVAARRWHWKPVDG